MAQKRKQAQDGPSLSQSSKRVKFEGVDSLRWNWVDQTINSDAPIPLKNLLSSCAFTPGKGKNICPNKYAEKSPRKKSKSTSNTATDHSDACIVISSDSDDALSVCRIRDCRNNPQCLNYLGQAKWEDEDAARDTFLDLANLEMNPILFIRDPSLPVGLKNLGATCYANAYLQVWFQDLVFRAGVYQCQPMVEEHEVLEKSPVFQLQVTFAALQASSQRVFNPIRLVESLELQTSVQQDAQEFSKLFLSHLAAEFEKQSIPSLRSLVADQFQGEVVHAIECQTCKNISEKSTDFVEIEINLQPRCRLEDRVKASLAPEMLVDDNKYACGHCNSLQEAKRCTKLSKLPPVLHFSILRFVYDTENYTRKKSKQSISYPASIDVSQFIGQSGSDACWYDLRGVLLHKGPSAYRGHYESQVYDEEQRKWFQFNDDEVTPLDDKDDDQRPHKPGKKAKFRVNDSDDESTDAEQNIRRLESKDAYMLIYVRREPEINSETNERRVSPNLQPPPHAMQAVQQLNEQHEQSMVDFYKRSKELEYQFQVIRREKQAIYRSWQIANHEDLSAVVPRKVLEDWLADELTRKPATDRRSATPQPSAGDATPDVPMQAGGSRSVDTESADSDVTLLNSSAEPAERLGIEEDKDIKCSHGQLDPSKFALMKRISKEAYERMAKQTKHELPGALMSDQVCVQCVKILGQEKLYPTTHKLHVEQFDTFQESLGKGDSFWLSKSWYKDWRANRPQMHKSDAAFRGDPPPDSGKWREDVLCGHQKLSVRATHRIPISEEAYRFLQQLFPGWITLPTTYELCSTCSDAASQEQARNLTLLNEGEEELHHLTVIAQDDLVSNPDRLDFGQQYYTVPTKFMWDWDTWVGNPTKCSRPENVNKFKCRHDRSVVDLKKCSRFKDTVAFVLVEDCEILRERYPNVAWGIVQRVDDDGVESWFQEPPRCEICSPRWYREQPFELKIIRIPPGHPIPTPSDYEVSLPDSLEDTVDKSPERTNGRRAPISGPLSSYFANASTRRSSRLVNRKRTKVLTMSATLSDTTEYLKDELAEKIQVEVAFQRLFYKGREMGHLDTLADLCFGEDDVLELCAFDPDADEPDALDCFWDEAEPVKTGKTEKIREGPAFGGTVLGGRRPITKKSSEILDQEQSQDNAEIVEDLVPAVIIDEAMDIDARPSSQPPSEDLPSGMACPRCTFVNPEGVSCCTMCEGPFSA